MVELGLVAGDGVRGLGRRLLNQLADRSGATAPGGGAVSGDRAQIVGDVVLVDVARARFFYLLLGVVFLDGVFAVALLFRVVVGTGLRLDLGILDEALQRLVVHLLESVKRQRGLIAKVQEHHGVLAGPV